MAGTYQSEIVRVQRVQRVQQKPQFQTARLEEWRTPYNSSNAAGMSVKDILDISYT
jgi:hypothetical protein